MSELGVRVKVRVRVTVRVRAKVEVMVRKLLFAIAPPPLKQHLSLFSVVSVCGCVGEGGLRPGAYIRAYVRGVCPGGLMSCAFTLEGFCLRVYVMGL